MIREELMPPKPKELFIYVNGELLPESQAKISVMDRGLQYGDGCFDTWCGRNGFIFQFDAHLDRLYRSVHVLKLPLKTSKSEMKQKIIDCVRMNSLADVFIKVVVTRGISSEPVLTGKYSEPSVIIYTRPIQIMGISEDIKARGLRVKVLSIRRQVHDSLDPKIKSLNYLNTVMGKLEVRDSHFDEGIMLDHNGYVCESTTYNILAVTNKKLIAPKSDILMGITRDSVMMMAREMGMQVEEGLYTVYDFLTADEVFFTSTASGIVSVVDIDGSKIGSGKPGPYAQKFKEIYLNWLLTGKHGTQVFPEAWG